MVQEGLPEEERLALPRLALTYLKGGLEGDPTFVKNF